MADGEGGSAESELPWPYCRVVSLYVLGRGRSDPIKLADGRYPHVRLSRA